jgi:murein tripeptide amidase MpaA
VSPDGADYVLVDRHGRRGPDLTREELSVQLEEGRAALLGDRAEPIADRALRSVLRRLAH